MKKPADDLIFPSGRSVGNCRRDAKRMARAENIPLWQALDRVASDNTRFPTWALAMRAFSTDRH